jgi:hypothetical protein
MEDKHHQQPLGWKPDQSGVLCLMLTGICIKHILRAQLNNITVQGA